MTLSAESPWGAVLDGQAHVLSAEIHRRHPDLGDVAIAAVGRTVWLSGPAVHASPLEATWRLAEAVAHMWPKWLAPAGVGARFAVGGMTVAASAGAMTMLAGGAERATWFETVTIG